MKKAIASFLCGAMLLQGTAIGVELKEEANTSELVYEESDSQFWQESCCATDPNLLDELHSALIDRKAETFQADYGIAAYTLRPHYGAVTTMPSVGEAKMLVLPIAFPDYPQYKEVFDAEAETHRLFDPYDPNKLPGDQSVRGFYHQASNQRLDITGTVLPIYDAPLPSTDYENTDEESNALITAALEAQNIDFSEYDSNNDGVLDALMVVCLLPRNLPSMFWWSKVWGTYLTVGDYQVQRFIFTGTGLNADLTATYTHETGHLLGLPDSYGKGSATHFELDSSLEELMNSRAYYINAYFKYLLDWIDPIIITYDDDPQEIELPPVELCQEGGEKAVVLIPGLEAFPFCEYFIAEYRAGGATEETETIFDETPGIVIWHCNTYIDETKPNKPYRTGSTLEPIHKSGSSSSTAYSKDDIYAAGDKFRPEDSGTGAYLEVVNTTPEKAVLHAGYHPLMKNNGPRPIITISNLVTALRPFGDYERDAVPAFQVDVDLDGKTITSAERSRITSGMFAVTVTETIKPNFSIIDNPDKTNSIISRLYRAQGEGTIRIQLPAGLLSKNAKDSKAVTSEIIYIDNTPPEIELRGKNPQRIQKGTAYTELGAVATDNLDPDIENKLQINASAVDTDTPGTYTVIYSVTDHVDFTTTVERTVIVEEKTPPHTHQYSPNWSNDGSKHWHECECGKRADEAAHTPVTDPAVAATCTTSGKTEGSHCSVCGYVIKAQVEISALEHSYSSTWESNSTSHWHECSKCHDKHDLAAHAEDAGTVTKHPALEETGIKSYSCSICGYEMRTEILDKLEPSHEHSFSETWSKDGASHWHECNKCGTKTDEATHTPVTDPAVAATCTIPGKTEGSHCSVCGYIITAQTEIPALKHQISGNWHCDGDHGPLGHWRICNNCKDIFDLENHVEDTGVITKAPTSTTPGIKTYSCSVCGYEMRMEAIPKLEPEPTPTSTPTPPSTPTPTPPVDPGPGPDQPVTPPPREPEPTETPRPQPPIESEPPAMEKKKLPFTDVKVNSWYYTAVDRMYQEGLMGGTSQTTFSPTIPASRAMLVTILYRLEGEPVVADPTRFPDVKAKWCVPAIAWAEEHEIVLGYADGNFGPNDEVTREQVAAILFRYAQYKGWDTTARGELSQYSDSGKIHKYAREAMEWAVGTGLIGGRTQDWLAPRETTTRAELAVMLMRFEENIKNCNETRRY